MKILLVDDHELFRAGLRLLLSGLDDDLEVFQACSCEDACTLSGSIAVDLVLLDYRLPGKQGVDALRTLRELQVSARFVVISAEEGSAAVSAVIDAGAVGFVPKASSHSVMLAAIRLVLAGGVYLPPHVLAATNGAASRTPFELRQVAAPPPLSGLTLRQVETLRLAMRGLANKRISRELQISEATVKAHLSAAFRALGVSNRTEAVFAAARSGITV